jgi:hypothetical protein
MMGNVRWKMDSISARIFDIFNKTIVISTGTQWNGEIYLNRFSFAKPSAPLRCTR